MLDTPHVVVSLCRSDFSAENLKDLHRNNQSYAIFYPAYTKFKATVAISNPPHAQIFHLQIVLQPMP